MWLNASNFNLGTFVLDFIEKTQNRQTHSFKTYIHKQINIKFLRKGIPLWFFLYFERTLYRQIHINWYNLSKKRIKTKKCIIHISIHNSNTHRYTTCTIFSAVIPKLYLFFWKTRQNMHQIANEIIKLYLFVYIVECMIILKLEHYLNCIFVIWAK